MRARKLLTNKFCLRSRGREMKIVGDPVDTDKPLKTPRFSVVDALDFECLL
jgi:hypothetical protein